MIGSYPIVVKAEITHYQDHTKMTTTKVSNIFEFTVYMTPCRITDYVETLKVVEIRYALGERALQDGPYTFDEKPFCGYPETVTLTNLPGFVTHNGASSDFTVPQNGDLSLIGEYTVNIRSEVQVPDDHTQSTFTSFEVNYDFLVVIDPCVIDAYVASIFAADISYDLGATALINVSPYAFEQQPACGYAETVTLTNLPAFVTQNVAQADFTVPLNSDLSLIGQYPVTIRGEIQVPIDAKKSAYDTLFVEYDFLVTIEPCRITDYVGSVRVIELRYNVGAISLTDGFYQFDELPVCGYPETVTL